MWKEKLEKIEKEKRIYGEKINKGVDDATLENLRKELEHRFDVDLPQEYANVLKTVNGLEFNGYILYGVDEEFIEYEQNQAINGIIEINSIWYENENQRAYLFIGESNITWYAYMLNTHEYVVLDNPSGRVLKKYIILDEMVDHILEESLI